MNLDESYRLLRVKPGTSFLEIRNSYHRLVKFFHPDKHQANLDELRKATEETQKLNVAYEHICRALGPKALRETGSTSRPFRRRSSSFRPAKQNSSGSRQAVFEWAALSQKQDGRTTKGPKRK